MKIQIIILSIAVVSIISYFLLIGIVVLLHAKFFTGHFGLL